jgi:hypothetical protein
MAWAGRLHRRGSPFHARVEDALGTGKDTGIGRFPSHDFSANQAWLTAATTAQILLAWLKPLPLDGDLARAEPKPCATGSCTPPGSCTVVGADGGISSNWPGADRSPGPRTGSVPYRTLPDQHEPSQ